MSAEIAAFFEPVGVLLAGMGNVVNPDPAVLLFDSAVVVLVVMVARSVIVYERGLR